jgi:hypothetical protein
MIADIIGLSGELASKLSLECILEQEHLLPVVKN